MSDTTKKKTWHTMTPLEKARVIAWLRQSVAGEQVEPDLREAAANELESPTWGEGGDTW
jgi:hypothetical protein